MTPHGDTFKSHRMMQSTLQPDRPVVIKCHTDHLHVETKLLPIKYHSELLAKQYWLSCYQSHHPSHHLTTLPAPARNMKGTLIKYNSEVVPLSDEGITDVDTYCDCLPTLHSQAVIEAKTHFVPSESLELRHPISHLLKVCCLGQSVPLSPSCVLVTVGF